ncbi:hypothetical protein AJ79_02853 [Helicocarpus griseus UAMH5409]|uniref:Uncharacterized protein n=1 Tax=Helicocarpus griseus UAMH5409 TaxID=1447875 RepID=A0A2B7Y1U4_9EURO|nr:hypothetical protein AJ79_02853 [Helicocarpus griseus UAMH5409]
MANVTLMEYLQMGPFNVPINPPTNPGPNTMSDMYNHSQIRNLGEWEQFSLPTIINLMADTTIPWDPFINSPPTSIAYDDALRHEISRQTMKKLAERRLWP